MVMARSAQKLADLRCAGPFRWPVPAMLKKASRARKPGMPRKTRKPGKNVAGMRKQRGKDEWRGSGAQPSPVELFGARTQMNFRKRAASQRRVGILIADANTGQVLFDQNADRYFVPASNMKIVHDGSCAGDARSGLSFPNHTGISSGARGGWKNCSPLYLVGRGDPNLSNRKFPFDLKEEFYRSFRKGDRRIGGRHRREGRQGNIRRQFVGDDSYFPRDRYPNGWEIDDMVWEYGAAISAIVLDDNTVQLTLTPGDHAGDRVDAVVAPDSAGICSGQPGDYFSDGSETDLTLKREPGSNVVTLLGTLPAKSNQRKLTLAIQEPALQRRRHAETPAGDRRHQSQRPGAAAFFAAWPHGGRKASCACGAPLDSAGTIRKAGKQNQPESAHGNAVAYGGQAKRCVEHPGRFGEFCRELLFNCRDTARRCGADRCSGIVAARSGDAARVVALLLYVQKQPWFGAYLDASRGRHRWNARGSHEEQHRRGKIACEDRFSRTCANAIRFTLTCQAEGGWYFRF